MFRSFSNKSLKIALCMQYSHRFVKSYKFLPPVVRTTYDNSKLPPPTEIDQPTIELLERLSLVGFENERGIKIVEDAIRFADHIFEVNTENVQPLVTVLEDEALFLRDDEVEPDATKKDILSNSQFTEEDFFITPIGNLEYIPKEKVSFSREKILQN